MFWTPLAQEIEVIAGSAPISVLRNHPLVSFRHVIWKKSFGHPSQKKIPRSTPCYRESASEKAPQYTLSGAQVTGMYPPSNTGSTLLIFDVHISDECTYKSNMT